MNRKFRIAGLLFIILFLLPMLLTALIPILGQKDISEEENRTLQKLPGFSLSSFLEGTFQDELEDALCDQYPASAEIKLTVLDFQNGVGNLEKQMIYAAAPSLRGSYEQIGEGYYHYKNDMNRIVEKPSDRVNDPQQLAQFAEKYAQTGGPELYVYFIENSRVVDFDSPEEGHAVAEAVMEALAPAGSAVFTVQDYDDYCTRFYQTDHHWNPDGAYEGYCAIIRMMLGEDAALNVPQERVELPVVFNGSYARQTHNLCADEHFSLDTFDLPKYKTFINGKKDNYGHASVYSRGKCPDDELRNHYAYCFGGDYALVEYDFKNADADNLLMIASSYSNPINDLIASHFNKTYVADLRYYAEWAGEELDLSAFCSENDIDKVLLLGDVNLFYQSEREEAGEE